MNQRLSSLIQSEHEGLKTYEIETKLNCPVTKRIIHEKYNFSTLTEISDRSLLIKSIKDQLRTQGLRAVIENSKVKETTSFVSFRCELYDIQQDPSRTRKPKKSKEKERKTSQVRRAVSIKSCPCPFYLRLVFLRTMGCWHVAKYVSKHIGHRVRTYVADTLNEDEIEALVKDRYTHGISTASVIIP